MEYEKGGRYNIGRKVGGGRRAKKLGYVKIKRERDKKRETV
jgi:hypothetical protein